MTDFNDPEFNYTVSPNEASGLRVPEHTVRQLISFGLKQIRQNLDATDNNLVDQLFRRLPDDVRTQIKDWLRQHENIFVGVNWPREDLSLPFITVVNEASVEDEANAMLGDYAGAAVLGSIDGGFMTTREKRAIPERDTTSVYVAADDANLTLYLSTLVRFILVSNKDDLAKWCDMHNLAVSMQDVKWDQSFLPTFCYIRNAQMTYTTYFDYAVTGSASKLVSLELMVSTHDSLDLEVISQVPYTDP